MSRKAHPVGFRLGVNANWFSPLNPVAYVFAVRTWLVLVQWLVRFSQQNGFYLFRLQQLAETWDVLVLRVILYLPPSHRSGKGRVRKLYFARTGLWFSRRRRKLKRRVRVRRFARFRRLKNRLIRCLRGEALVTFSVRRLRPARSKRRRKQPQLAAKNWRKRRNVKHRKKFGRAQFRRRFTKFFRHLTLARLRTFLQPILAGFLKKHVTLQCASSVSRKLRTSARRRRLLTRNLRRARQGSGAWRKRSRRRRRKVVVSSAVGAAQRVFPYLLATALRRYYFFRGLLRLMLIAIGYYNTDVILQWVKYRLSTVRKHSKRVSQKQFIRITTLLFEYSAGFLGLLQGVRFEIHGKVNGKTRPTIFRYTLGEKLQRQKLRSTYPFSYTAVHIPTFAGILYFRLWFLYNQEVTLNGATPRPHNHGALSCP